MIDSYQKITAARLVLELPETATKESIKKNYRRLLARWHPDKCMEQKEMCDEMTRKIIAAHAVIMEYCQQYQYSFSEESVKRHQTSEEWWFARFGVDPIWGDGQKRKSDK
ncbi:J domain-containing protein [Desulfocastanea catecholica]